MLMLQVRYTLQEGKDPAAFVHALEQADIPARTRAETGCCQYEFFYSASSPNEVLLLEAWADEIAQQAHKGTAQCAELQKVKAQYVADVSFRQYTAEGIRRTGPLLRGRGPGIAEEVRMNCVIDKMTSPRSLLMIQRAKELQKRDSSYISLAGGEPDFDTPAAVTEAAIASLRRGNTHYVVGPGIPELRQEIQQKLLRENGIQTEADRILVTPGGKMAIYLAVQAVLNHGDKVLLPEPAWVSYESIVISAGAEAVKVPLSPADHYRLTEALLEQHYTPEVRLIIINYPNNPTGRILHQDEAEALSAFMQRHPDVLLLSDEVYDAIVYDGVRSISMASRPEVADRVITINGFSKFAAMTGWRMGYLTARRDIYAAIYKLYQQSVSCMSGFLQEGAVQAFRIPDEVEAMRQSYQRRRDAFVGRLNAIPGVHCQMPEGAFYAWVSFDVDMTSDEMCDYILDHAKVVGVSGAAYGMTQGCFLRFSFASDDAALSAAADRIEAAMRAYQQR